MLYFGNFQIKDDKRLFYLNDIWDKDETTTPAKWLRKIDTIEFIRTLILHTYDNQNLMDCPELVNDLPNKLNLGTQEYGNQIRKCAIKRNLLSHKYRTRAHWTIFLEYARYLYPAFKLWSLFELRNSIILPDEESFKDWLEDL